MAKKRRTLDARQKLYIRIAYGFVLALLVVFGVAATFLLHTTTDLLEFAVERSQPSALERASPSNPFPVGVDPRMELITEHSGVDAYLADQLAYAEYTRPKPDDWWGQLVANVVQSTWFQNLAASQSRLLVIWPSDRREAAVDNFGDILEWNAAERAEFTERIASSSPAIREGKFFPGRYVTGVNATPEEVAALVLESFEAEVLARYPEEVAAQVSLEDALTIASLLEREAYDFSDMRTISGVIWNRLFADMPLQLDATLQYARGSDPRVPVWWPPARASDKFIDSPYNTYEHKGLPPAPIANPAPAAILAALNPRATDCMYYFHDDAGDFYCSETYNEHLTKLRAVYGYSQ